LETEPKDSSYYGIDWVVGCLDSGDMQEYLEKRANPPFPDKGKSQCYRSKISAPIRIMPTSQTAYKT